MDAIVAVILFVCAIAVMAIVAPLTDHRGNHTVCSFLAAIAAILLLFCSVMSLYVLK